MIHFIDWTDVGLWRLIALMEREQGRVTHDLIRVPL